MTNPLFDVLTLSTWNIAISWPPRITLEVLRNRAHIFLFSPQSILDLWQYLPTLGTHKLTWSVCISARHWYRSHFSHQVALASISVHSINISSSLGVCTWCSGRARLFIWVVEPPNEWESSLEMHSKWKMSEPQTDTRRSSKYGVKSLGGGDKGERWKKHNKWKRSFLLRLKDERIKRPIAGLAPSARKEAFGCCVASFFINRPHTIRHIQSRLDSAQIWTD